ncbi:MAG TPA: ATP-binding protein [Myxococcales bacterium]|nr:ATP-binding protein [Myxococcales bacterium]
MDDPVVKALRAAISARDDAELRCALGERLLQLGQPADARLEFEAALELQPAHARALDGMTRTAPAEDRHAAPAEDEERPRLRVVSDETEEPQQRAITFADVAGMEDARQRLTRSFLLPLRNPELVKQFGKSASGGLLLYGPPGCGKTFLARALAGEIGARFVNVGLQDVLDLWFGESERKLHELFENARRRAPTVLFFDEVDALGQRRTQLKGSAGRNLVNQLLSEMDGFDRRNEGVFFFAATNHPWDVDPALRRPGRFDRLVFVPPPDAEARKAIFKLKLEGRPVARTVDGAQLSKATDGFSGADIEGVCKAAAELALEASVEAGRVVPIDGGLLAKALRDAKASTRPWFEVARNHAVYANEGGVYDELLAHLRGIGLA